MPSGEERESYPLGEKRLKWLRKTEKKLPGITSERQQRPDGVAGCGCDGIFSRYRPNRLGNG